VNATQPARWQDDVKPPGPASQPGGISWKARAVAAIAFVRHRPRAMMARASSSGIGGPSTGCPVWPATLFMAA